MNPTQLDQLLKQVASGEVDPTAASGLIRNLTVRDLGFAHVDLHRKGRTGFPEVVLGRNKTDDEILHISREIAEAGQDRLVTRCEPGAAALLQNELDRVELYPRSGCVTRRAAAEPEPVGLALVVSAGTGDYPVAEEAVVTARMMGARVEELYDVGVAGIHRLLLHEDLLRKARVIVVAAGMEGALASVVGGLVSVPVVAVPTSTGYGASFGGVSALLTMLNSCAAGVSVVNIDNGFGAGYAAALINRLPTPT